LENGCQSYADKAVKLAAEWEQLLCQKKLNVSPQLFATDRNYQYNRCRNSVGTTIASDLESMENELKPCRAISGQSGNPPGNPPENPPVNPPGRPSKPLVGIARPDNPPTDPGGVNGDLWEIVVINSADLYPSRPGIPAPAAPILAVR
jgi:hypothetical protein